MSILLIINLIANTILCLGGTAFYWQSLQEKQV